MAARKPPRKVRSDKGRPRNCRNTIAMRHALTTLSRLLNQSHTGNSRLATRVSQSRIAEMLGVDKRTLARWLAIKTWPTDAMLPKILGLCAALSQASTSDDGDVFTLLQRNPFVTPVSVTFRVDTGGADHYDDRIPANWPEMFSAPGGWIGSQDGCGTPPDADPEASR